MPQKMLPTNSICTLVAKNKMKMVPAISAMAPMYTLRDPNRDCRYPFSSRPMMLPRLLPLPMAACHDAEIW